MSSQAAATQREEAAWLRQVPGFLLSLAIVVGLAIAANRLADLANRPFGRQLLEYPLWAASLGLLANLILGLARVKDRVSQAFRTELFLKTGLVLMGATVNFGDLLRVGAKGLVQAVVLISAVFFFTWWLGRVFKLDAKLRALMATSVSICGVSAAIAAAGSVMARREQLAYVTALVILFALPLMVVQPLLAIWLGLPIEVAGAWIGGNIDTTAAVVGAGAIHSEAAMQVASIVKMSQNALIGVAAFLLALYWVVRVEGKPDQRPQLIEIWRRFPKFVLGFILASAIATVGLLSRGQVADVTALRNWFLTLAFVSIGLEFALAEFRSIGGRPVLVFFLATVFNTVVALGVAWIIFGGVLNI